MQLGALIATEYGSCPDVKHGSRISFNGKTFYIYLYRYNNYRINRRATIHTIKNKNEIDIAYRWMAF
jgi:hypothetical protein